MGERQMSEPFWAIAYSTNSSSPRAQKWYRVVRVVEADGKLWELYWHTPDADKRVMTRGSNRDQVREAALRAGLKLVAGLYKDAPSPRHGSELVRTSQK
jgi:hypothetical protein